MSIGGEVPPRPLGPLGKAVHCPAKDLSAVADGEQRRWGRVLRSVLDVRAVRATHSSVCVRAGGVGSGGGGGGG